MENVGVERQIKFIGDAVVKDTGWHIMRRAISKYIYADKSYPFILLFYNVYEDRWLMMLHKEDGYYNIERKYQTEVEEDFLCYMNLLDCEIEYENADILV